MLLRFLYAMLRVRMRCTFLLCYTLVVIAKPKRKKDIVRQYRKLTEQQDKNIDIFKIDLH